MQYVIAVFSALLPAFFLVGYVWFRDKNKREPIREVLRGVWNGVLSIALALIIVTPCTWLQQLLPFFAEGNGIWGAVGTAFLSAAIPEEIAKFVMFRSLVKDNRYFDERMDGVVYAAAVSMGFAGVENVLYLLDNLDALLGVGLIRALFSVPGHFFYAVFMGYFYSLACFGDGRKKELNYVLALLVPIILHGVFDSLLFVMPHITPIWVLLVLILFVAFNIWINVMAHKRMRIVLKADEDMFATQAAEASVAQQIGVMTGVQSEESFGTEMEIPAGEHMPTEQTEQTEPN